MDDSANTEREDVEDVYVQWRIGAPVPTVTELMSQTTFENLLKATWVAGWVSRGRIPASTGARR